MHILIISSFLVFNYLPGSTRRSYWGSMSCRWLLPGGSKNPTVVSGRDLQKIERSKFTSRLPGVWSRVRINLFLVRKTFYCQFYLGFSYMNYEQSVCFATLSREALAGSYQLGYIFSSARHATALLRQVIWRVLVKPGETTKVLRLPPFYYCWCTVLFWIMSVYRFQDRISHGLACMQRYEFYYSSS
jgi:hypothetical protein